MSDTSVSSRVLYTAQPGQTTFPIPFPFSALADIRVSVGDVAVDAVALAGVEANPGFSAGSVTIPAQLAGAQVLVFRQTVPVRMVDFPFPSRVLDIRALNGDLDRLYYLAQEGVEQTNRALAQIRIIGQALDTLREQTAATDAALEARIDGVEDASVDRDLSLERQVSEAKSAVAGVSARVDSLQLTGGVRDIPFTPRECGADTSGASDAVGAFETAVLATGSLSPGKGAVTVRVTAGTYSLSRQPKTLGRHVTWRLDDGATILPDPGILPGRVVTPYLTAMQGTFGWEDNMSSAAIFANSHKWRVPVGYDKFNRDFLGDVHSRDHVAFYIDSQPPYVQPDVEVSGFTETSFSPVPPVDIERLRVGMGVDTTHSPQGYSALITGWSPDGTRVEVDRWSLAPTANQAIPGSNAPGIVPPPSGDVRLNPMTKIWGQNTNVFALTFNPQVRQFCGYELGTWVTHPHVNPDDDKEYRGFDSVAFRELVRDAFVARGNHRYGFRVTEALDAGFVCENAATAQFGTGYMGPRDPAVAFLTRGTGSAFRGVDPATEQAYVEIDHQGDGGGRIQLGQPAAPFGSIRIGPHQVIGPREIWVGGVNGTGSTATFDADSAGPEQVRQAVASIIRALKAHGLIG